MLANAYEDDRASFDQACDSLKMLISGNGPFNDRCAICGSDDLHFEVGTTPYKTLQEAAQFIGETVQDNARTRQELERRGMTFAARRRN